MSVIIDSFPGIDESDLTGATIVPVGTTAERPTDPKQGELRYNTDNHVLEFYNKDKDVWASLEDTTNVN